MPIKMRIGKIIKLWKPRCPSAAGGSAPRPPCYYSHILSQHCWVCLALKAFCYYRKYNKSNNSKCSAFWLLRSFIPIFHFNLCSFCWWGRKNTFASGLVL